MPNNSIQYIYEIIDRYTPTLKKMNRAQKKFKKMLSVSQKQLEKFRKKVRATAKSMKDFGRSMSIRLTLPIVTAFGFMTREIVNAEETFSKFGVVFKDVAKDANVAFKDLRDNFGLSQVAAKKLLSDTGDLLSGFGFTQAEALDLSIQVNKLAVDLASFSNIEGGTERASQALTKGLLGERESMKLLGVAVNENNADFKALIKNIQSTTGKSLIQAKALATLKIAQIQSKNAIGDFARTSQSAANQSKLFTQRLSDLSVTFTAEILPVFTKIITTLNQWILRFSEVSPAMRKFVLITALLIAALGPLIIFMGQIAFALLFLNPVVIGITIAVAALVGAIIFLASQWDNLMNSLRNSSAFKAVAQFVAVLSESIQQLSSLMSNLSQAASGSGVGKFFSGGFVSQAGNAFAGSLDVNINAPKGTVQSVSQRTKGSGLKLGQTMRES